MIRFLFLYKVQKPQVAQYKPHVYPHICPCMYILLNLQTNGLDDMGPDWPLIPASGVFCEAVLYLILQF